MPDSKYGKQNASRRTFLKQMRWVPVVFFSAPIRTPLIRSGLHQFAAAQASQLPFAEVPFTPHYPAKSGLDDVLRLANPGTDEYVLEGYAFELAALLEKWSQHLKKDRPATAVLSKFVDSSIQSTTFCPIRESPLRSGDHIEVIHREFPSVPLPGRDRFLEEIKNYLAPLKQIETADFEIYDCKQVAGSPLTIEVSIRYDFVGTRADQEREERIGSWLTQWSANQSGGWRALKWIAAGETISRAAGPIFVDITSHVLGQTDSYKNQLLRGADYWRTVLDGAVGVDVYGNNGLAVGDFDNDGRDDLYVCQPAGLPNRLYRNRGDGTLEDVTEKAGVGVLDFTACALFADFDNRGLQDLLVVCATGPLLFRNDGDGHFSRKADAFRFTRPPEGAFTHAAAADYDHDGRLDIYFCLYSYYQGLDQYRYPVPYFDARNGPPNYLFHNEGNGVFQDRTEAASLNIDNDRYSFACSWGDSNGNLWPDLYVVNDFGRNNLYRNNGDGTFAAVSAEAHVDEAGAGMSACWLDFDNDGKQDIYAAGMWVAAGLRVFGDSHFHAGEPEKIRSLYRRHMTGNSLYRNQGDGKFKNLAAQAGVEMGRWSWSTDAWDFDHDGYPDLYVANGYISGIDPRDIDQRNINERDVSSFFWRQVVAQSPQDSSPSPSYERGWSAINELIRSDSTWNGHERNVFFANNRDGTFSDVSGVVGLDFRDDSRAFALADLDGDGRLEVVLKNRNAPQIRILRLSMDVIGHSIALRLRGNKSNRDAIGTAVTVEVGELRQTKYLQAGSGFLSQHTKELSFGLGKNEGLIQSTIRWPSGLTQRFGGLPINHRIEIQEGARDFTSRPFAPSPQSWAQTRSSLNSSGETLPASAGTWLIEPVKALDFSLPDPAGNLRDLRSFLGAFFLLNFWTTASSACREQFQLLRKSQSALASRGLKIAAINVDDPSDPRALKSFASKEDLSFPILLATPEVAGIYNILYRYLFDRHRNLSLPVCFLIDEDGNIVKVYQGPVAPEDLLQDLASVPKIAADRIRKALPFPGTLQQEAFQRNAFTYGVAFFQHGFLDQAEQSFKQVIAAKADDPECLLQPWDALPAAQLSARSTTLSRTSREIARKLSRGVEQSWNDRRTGRE